MTALQNDAFKKFSKDLQDALVIPVNYINKKTKKTPMNEKKKQPGLSGLYTSGLQASSMSDTVDEFSPHSNLNSDSVSLHNFSLSTISKASSDDNRSITSSNGSTMGMAGIAQQQHPSQLSLHSQTSVISGNGGKRSRASSFLRSPLSPGAFGGNGGGNNKVSSKLLEEPPLVHCPPSVASLDQFSPERHAWVRSCLAQHQLHSLQPSLSQLTNVLKSERAWDTAEGNFENQSTIELNAPGRTFVKSGYNNPNEATGLVLVKLMQVTNRASSKIYDIECNLRVGNVERTSHPSRSFRDNPGNTAMMNEVFLFDINEPFRLDFVVTGAPVATKFGTIAGFASAQTVHLGQVSLSLPLESMEKSVRTYKLRRPAEGSQPCVAKTQSKDKADCEIVVMIGVHVLEEPVEDRSWETETLYESDLTVMTRGSRMTAWKRYWAVLLGSSVKLYDAEYQMKRDPIVTIPLAHVLGVQPPDYDKVDVSANGFSIVISRTGVDMTSADEFDLTDMDYSIYAFTDSSSQHEFWNGRLEEALDRYRDHMARREEIQDAKRRRRERRSTRVDEDDDQDVEVAPELIDLRFVS
ncbi:hypothetical protein BGZ51_002905 [Haplosporangium sp. Z 767]|nr:hypothetical protein BGZ51_002905 [Haplosporangium sp. Z 767]KAF9185955.1 hypothetical protein BGZ50_002800 [Haplosporangium sp. Z 11]